MCVGTSRIGAELIADEEEPCHPLFQVAWLEAQQIALLASNPPRPRSCQAVGLQFADDRRAAEIVEPETGLYRVTPLMGEDQRHREVTELLEERGHQVLGIPAHRVVDRAVEGVRLELLALERSSTERNVTLGGEIWAKLRHRLPGDRARQVRGEHGRG